MNYRLLLQGSDFHPHLSHDRYGSINCHNQLIKYKCVRPDANLFVEYLIIPWASLVAQLVKNLPTIQETLV